MPKISSYEELKQLHAEYAKRIQIRLHDANTNSPVITYNTAHCDAALATEVIETLMQELQSNNLFHIPVINSANLAHPTEAPLFCINMPDGSSFLYGQLTSEKIGRIVRSHLVEGKVCEDLLMPQFNLPQN